MELSTVQKGTIGELLAKALFMKQGFNVYDKVNEDTKCDFILEKNYKLIKIQVKIIQTDKGNKVLTTRKTGHSKTENKIHHYTKDEIDFYVGVDIDTYNLYILSMDMYETIKSSLMITKLDFYKNNFNQLELFTRNSKNEHDNIGETLTDNADGNTEGMNINSARRD